MSHNWQRTVILFGAMTSSFGRCSDDIFRRVILFSFNVIAVVTGLLEQIITDAMMAGWYGKVHKFSVDVRVAVSPNGHCDFPLASRLHQVGAKRRN
jgi:hypothetical protein